MKLLRLAGATLLSAALVAASGVAAFAEDGDGVCTITVQLPATAESGQPFTMHVVEDEDCAGISGLHPFTVGGYLTDRPANGYEKWGQDGVEFSHTPGTGDAWYQGTAPNPGTWKPRILDQGIDSGYEVVAATMVTTPQVTPTPIASPAKAVWVNDTLRITYPQVETYGGGMDEYWTTFVDGKSVDVDEYGRPGKYSAVEVPRKASAGPAKVTIVGTSVADIEDIYADTNTTIYSQTVAQQVVKAKRGQVSAATLLNMLKLSAETHSSSHAASKFGLWADADHDGENTRTEVLKSESLKKPVVSAHGTVRTGTWISRYDGKTTTVASKLDIDHLVPLKEAWTSGAAAWSAKKRTAYANDLGYGLSLIAVSKAARKSKGEQEIAAYLPPNASYRCSYVRNWIAVKYRWGLTIDPTEKNTLNSDLTLYCTSPYVTKPAKPNLTALVNQAGR
jgi:hypothetical protein